MTMKNVYEVQREWQRYWGEANTASRTEVCENVMRTKQYLDDEITEVLTAIGGEYGNAAWKHWKADHSKAAVTGLESLTEAEHEDLVGEVADVMIFAMNIGIQCGLDGDELMQAIREKQRVNMDRWKSNY